VQLGRQFFLLPNHTYRLWGSTLQSKDFLFFCSS
jgi:hypothetical protein